MGVVNAALAIDGEPFTVGVIVQANHGIRPWLTVLGVSVGQHMQDDRIGAASTEQGSIICLIGTDLPLLPSQLKRLARRAIDVETLTDILKRHSRVAGSATAQ